MEIQYRSPARLEAGEGRALWVLGELVTYKVVSEQTRGASSIFEVVVQPQGGPPPHIQHREDEWTYVLEGEFLKGGEVFRAGAGSFVYIPNGNLHTYKNVGNTAGRILVGQSPGGLLESFFEELGEEATDRETPPVMDGPPDVARNVETAARYGLEIPPPPGP